MRLVLGVLIGVVLLAAVLWRLDGSRMREVIAASEPIYLLPIAVTMTIHYVFKGLRWRVLLSARAPVSRLLAVRLTFIGFFMNQIFPARLGELGRPYLLSTNVPAVPFSFALATLFGDKLFDLSCVVVFLLISLAAVPLPEAVAQALAVTTVGCCGILAVGLGAAWWRGREQSRTGDGSGLRRLTSRAGRHGDRIYTTVLTFAEGLGALASVRRAVLSVGHTLACYGFLLVSTWCCARMVGIELGLLQCLFVIGVLGLSFMIPAPPTNAGNLHFFGTQALLVLGVAGLEQAFAFSAITHLAQVLSVSVVGPISLIGLDWRRLRELA